MAGGLDDGALEDRELRRARGDDRFGLGQEDGDVQLVHELAGGFDRLLVAAVDQCYAFGLQLDRGDGGGWERRFGDQGRDLGVGVGGFIGPAGAFADVDEGDGGVVAVGGGVLALIVEQGGFLGAGDHQGLGWSAGGFQCCDEAVQFGPA